MLAKITSELGKPAGLVVLSREEALERFCGESPGLIPGIGPKTVDQARGDGDPHPGRAARAGRRRCWSSPSVRARVAGCTAARTLEDETPVTVVRETKSQSAETTFDVDVADRAEIEAHLVQLSEELCRRLRKRELRGPHDRDQGPARRLDQRHPLAHGRGADQRPRRRPSRRPRPAARLRPASARCACSASASPASSSGEAAEPAEVDRRARPAAARPHRLSRFTAASQEPFGRVRRLLG